MVAIDLGLIFCKLQFVLVDLFILRIVRSNPSKVFTLRRFISLVFLGNYICVLFFFSSAVHDVIFCCLT